MSEVKIYPKSIQHFSKNLTNKRRFTKNVAKRPGISCQKLFTAFFSHCWTCYSCKSSSNLNFGQFFYRLVQKKCLLFEFAVFLLPTKSGQPILHQSALRELPSPNKASFLLLNPVPGDGAKRLRTIGLGPSKNMGGPKPGVLGPLRAVTQYR